MSAPTSLWWIRRDLRLDDNEALRAAAAAARRVVPLFVLDPALWEPAGPARRARLLASLHDLDQRLGGALVVRTGDPAAVLPAVLAEARAENVFVTGDFGPYGRRRDHAVETGLGAGVLVRCGSAYAAPPGEVRKPDGTAYQVFTPYHRAWQSVLEPSALGSAPATTWEHLAGEPLPEVPAPVDLGPVGELAALRRWQQFAQSGLCHYREQRDRPDLSGTSRLSTHLKFGEIHPHRLLADLRRHHCVGARSFSAELAWRDFYADVLWHQPHTARSYLRPQYAQMRYDPPGPGYLAWRAGRTGYPFVDAGMRQLAATGWLHNRLRMVAASFLVKDLHIEWTHGARHFMHVLLDGDLASNQHGWQWVAGCGTDAAPYHRVFNPVLQGIRFDPGGDYVRRWIPELAHLPGASAHEPWRHPDGYAHHYPARIVDHSQERTEALTRLAEITAAG